MTTRCLPLDDVRDGQRELGASRNAALDVTVDVEPVRVGHTIGSALVANADHGRESVLPSGGLSAHPGHEPERLHHLDPDLGAGARRQVAKPLLKRIRAILLQQSRRCVPRRALPIAGLGSLTPLDLAADDSVADANDVAEHGAVGRQRERVDHLEGLVVGVVEDLGERGQGEPGLGTRLEADADERIGAAVGGGESRSVADGGFSGLEKA